MRTHILRISERLWRNLQCVAELHGHDNVESVAEAWLTERMETFPAIQRRSEMISAAVKDAIQRWEAEQNNDAR